MKIGLISDTHSHMDEAILEHLKEVDEIWHAGDIGDIKVIEQLETLNKKMRVVYGNIDTKATQIEFPLNEIFHCEGIKVVITHIGGYPPRYYSRVRSLLIEEKPDLYVCGHSHILRVMKDSELNLLHMNPGACGFIGIHHMRSILLFEINKGKIENLRAVELGIRARLLSDEEVEAMD